jgi:peptidyl-tRNA hydrolase, PTH1 family
MKLIVGLGNPGREYDATRHNAGWWFLDHLAGVWHADAFRKDGQALATTVRVGDQPVRLVKPQTYMNHSGDVLPAVLRRPGFRAASDLLVLVDEVAIPVGTLRFRAKGSAGGHNGLKSVQQQVGGQDYPRLRLGIRSLDERRLRGDLADYVLDRMPRDERDQLEARFADATRIVEAWLREGNDAAARVAGPLERAPEA